METDLKEFIVSAAALGSDIIVYYNDRHKYKLKTVPKRGHIEFSKKIIDKLRDISYRYNEKVDYSSYLSYFDNVVSYYFPSELLDNYRRNISTLVINRLHFQIGDFLKVGRFYGRYNDKYNYIQIDADEESKVSLFHELFHLASNDMKRYNVGLSFNNGMGRALTEGYTDLLTERYFGNAGYKRSYYIESTYASLLEQIVGKEFMERCYLTADVRSLILELEKYDSMDNILCFINELDNYNSDEQLMIKKQKNFNMAYFLINSYIRKKVFNGENIFDLSVKRDILDYINKIPKSITYNNQEIEIDLAMITNDVVGNIIKYNYYAR